MAAVSDELLQKIREALAGRLFARAADLCELGLNQLPPPNEEETLRGLLADARRDLLPTLPPRIPPPEFWRGTEALGRGALKEARGWFASALEKEPACAEAHAHHGMALVGCGDFENGWEEFEWRRFLGWGERRDMIAPYWDGTSVTGGPLLLWDEQGNGDAIQFIRFAVPAARRAAASVVFHGRPRLCRLFRSCPAIHRAIPRSDDFPRPSAHASLMSLPAILRAGATGETVPYLFAEGALVDEWRQRLLPLARPRIGLVWQGNPGYPFDAGRSFPLVSLLPVLRAFAARAAFVSLQKGTGEEQLAALPADVEVANVGVEVDRGDDAYVETAAVLANLDLTITSDTSVAHLAGALGVRVWIVLGSGADWRWGEAPAATPFYPTARLFRRRRGEDWAPVMSRLADALGHFLARRSALS